MIWEKINRIFCSASKLWGPSVLQQRRRCWWFVAISRQPGAAIWVKLWGYWLQKESKTRGRLGEQSTPTLLAYSVLAVPPPPPHYHHQHQEAALSFPLLSSVFFLLLFLLIWAWLHIKFHSSMAACYISFFSPVIHHSPGISAVSFLSSSSFYFKL